MHLYKLFVMRPILFFCFTLIYFACQNAKSKAGLPSKLNNSKQAAVNFDTACKVAHTIVVLCDNQYQGIVPVPKAIGNGQDPKNNLYWGCSLGVKSYFKNSSQYTLVATSQVDSFLLERLVFKHKLYNFCMVADAINGKYMAKALKHYFTLLSGHNGQTIKVNGKTIGIGGYATMVNFIGHNGLMDNTVENDFSPAKSIQQKTAIILACKSKAYFSPYTQPLNVKPLVWTTQFMAPEAYTLHDAIEAYLQKQSAAQIHYAAAKAYAKYQKCSLKAALGLMAYGY
jgi:hypothetical protein